MKIKIKNNGSAPLENSGVVAGCLFPRVFREIPKRGLLETQVNPVRNLLVTRLEILISNGVKQSLTQRRFLTGSALLIVVFIAALLTVLVAGMLQITTEEILLMRNQIYAAEAVATAEAGMNDAFAELRSDSGWSDGFTDKSFNGGSYTVTVSGSLPALTIESEGTSSQGYIARVAADITVGTASPYIIRIDNLRINE